MYIQCSVNNGRTCYWLINIVLFINTYSEHNRSHNLKLKLKFICYTLVTTETIAYDVLQNTFLTVSCQIKLIGTHSKRCYLNPFLVKCKRESYSAMRRNYIIYKENNIH